MGDVLPSHRVICQDGMPECVEAEAFNNACGICFRSMKCWISNARRAVTFAGRGGNSPEA